MGNLSLRYSDTVISLKSSVPMKLDTFKKIVRIPKNQVSLISSVLGNSPPKQINSMKVLEIPMILFFCLGGESPNQYGVYREKKEMEKKEKVEWENFMKETRELLEE